MKTAVRKFSNGKNSSVLIDQIILLLDENLLINTLQKNDFNLELSKIEMNKNLENQCIWVPAAFNQFDCFKSYGGVRLIPNLIDKNSPQYQSRQIKLQAKLNFQSKSASNNGFGKNVNSKSRNPVGGSGGGSKENNKIRKETEKPEAKLTKEERKAEEIKKKQEMHEKKGRRIGDIIHCNHFY